MFILFMVIHLVRIEWHQLFHSPITLFHQIALFLTPKLFVSLELVHTVATLLALRVLHRNSHVG